MSEPGWMGASDRSSVLTMQSINRNQRKIMEQATMVQMKTTTNINDPGNWQPKNMSHAPGYMNMGVWGEYEIRAAYETFTPPSFYTYTFYFNV